MLGKKSLSRDPIVNDPTVDVRVLVGMWIGGALFKVGDTTRIQRSDAQSLSFMRRVEIITD